MARVRKGQVIDGLMLLDKPTGQSSNRVLQRVKRLLDGRKAGHTGSLDPLASGLLPICFGQATKFSRFLLDADKTYYVVAMLGCKTSTGDKEGEIIKSKANHCVSQQQISVALGQFTGSIEQCPPMYSAIKYKGRPLYEYARSGIIVERSVRRITIHSNRIISFENNLLALRVHCSKGTYIRTLIDDLGDVLGCGAHVVQLRRLHVGGFHAHEMVTLSGLEHCASVQNKAAMMQRILHVSEVVRQLPRVQLSSESVYHVRMGQAVLNAQAATTGFVRLFSEKGLFVGVGRVIVAGCITPYRLMKPTSMLGCIDEVNASV